MTPTPSSAGECPYLHEDTDKPGAPNYWWRWHPCYSADSPVADHWDTFDADAALAALREALELCYKQMTDTGGPGDWSWALEQARRALDSKSAREGA